MNIDVVIIGLNAGKTLGACIESVRASRYERGEVTIFYVDSGSTDQSVALAEAYPGVTVIPLVREYPSPGSGRNAGWRAGSAPLIQFLDSDTLVDPDWLERAVVAMGDDIGAVRGLRREKHPEASVFNWIADQEWNARPGECDDFGGDVLIRREALESTGGYDEDLVGGEDPELSQRVRGDGWKILQLPHVMTWHDLAMTRVGQYWKRAYRTGYGFAAVIDRHGGAGNGFWLGEYLRILIRGGAGPLSIPAGLAGGLLFHPLFLLFSVFGFGLVLFPRLLRVEYFAQDKDLDRTGARRYSWHCSLVVIPEFCGIVRYWAGKWFRSPLRNRRGPLFRQAAQVAGLFLWLALSGCTSARIDAGVHDFTRPDRRSQHPDYNVGNAFSAETEKEERTFASEEELYRFSNSVPADYYIGAGDIMEVSVRGRPDVSVEHATVSPDGLLSIPRIGIVNVKGKTIDEVTSEIREKFSVYYQDPDVTVLIHEYNNNKVYVLGRVAKPGLVKFGGTGTLIEALAQAGGLPTVAENAFLSRAVIFRGKNEVVWVDLREVLERGNVAMNPKLMNNDLVFIPESDDELVYVMGEVRTPGAVRLKTELSILDAIMAVGGPTSTAKLAKTYLIRYEDGKGHVQQIKMNRFIERGDLRQDYLLEDGDIIYLSTRPLEVIAKEVARTAPALGYLNFATTTLSAGD